MTEAISAVQGHKAKEKSYSWTALMHEIWPKQWKRAAARYQALSGMEEHKKKTLQVRLIFHIIYQPLSNPFPKKMPREDTWQVCSDTPAEPSANP